MRTEHTKQRFLLLFHLSSAPPVLQRAEAEHPRRVAEHKSHLSQCCRLITWGLYTALYILHLSWCTSWCISSGKSLRQGRSLLSSTPCPCTGRQGTISQLQGIQLLKDPGQCCANVVSFLWIDTCCSLIEGECYMVLFGIVVALHIVRGYPYICWWIDIHRRQCRVPESCGAWAVNSEKAGR